MADLSVPDLLPPGVARLRRHVVAVLEQSVREVGESGRAALAWHWALTGDRPSPITLSLPPGRSPGREEVLAEADADPEGSSAPPGVPSDFCDQIGEARRILRWLAGASDEIPVDCENRGELIGARGDYVRTDDEIREVRDRARQGLGVIDLPDPMDPADAANPWRWDPAWMNAAWLRGVRDILDWVLGDRPASPLRGQIADRPPLDELDFEDEVAEELARRGRPGGSAITPDAFPPPQYGEAIHAAIGWLRCVDCAVPVDDRGEGPYGSLPGGAGLSRPGPGPSALH